MGVIRIAGFSGMWPIRDPRALPDNAADFSLNTENVGGAYVIGRPLPELFRTSLRIGSDKGIARIPKVKGAPLRSTTDNVWREATTYDLVVLPGPITNDAFRRIYTHDPVAGLRVHIGTDASPYVNGRVVGVPGIDPLVYRPAVQPPASGTGPIVTRYYLYTYVNDLGEEGPPSAPSTPREGYSGGSWQVTIGWPSTITRSISMSTPEYPERKVVKIRLYRAVTSEIGATWRKVADYDIVTNNMTVLDASSDEVLAGASELESTTWVAPPSGLEGVVAMANGIFAGWKGRDLYFSESYRPWAWPIEYQITLHDEIVGCGVMGNSLVVATHGSPAIVTGTTPAAMSMVQIDQPLACVSRRSIVSAPEGVYFATSEGLVIIGQGGSGYVSPSLISQQDWKNVFKPEGIQAVMHEQNYLAYNPLMAIAKGFMFSPSNPSNQGLVLLDYQGVQNPDMLIMDRWTNTPIMVGGLGTGNRLLYEIDPTGGVPSSWVWRSKEFQYPYPTNFKVYQAWFDDRAGTEPIRLKIYATSRGKDGLVMKRVAYDEVIPRSGQEVKLPSGFLADIWQFEFSGNGELQSFEIATSTRELRDG